MTLPLFFRKPRLNEYLPPLRAGAVIIILALLGSFASAQLRSFLSPKESLKSLSIEKFSDFSRLEELAREPGTVLLDARAARLFSLGHLPGARNIPPEALEKPTGELPEALYGLSRDNLLITYCADPLCPLAENLALFLKNQGFSNILIFTQGFDGYLDSGRPTEEEPIS
jgi:rhodanese-related sulfurtransferase